MKIKSRLLIAVVWAALIYTLYRLNLLSGNMDNINLLLSSCGSYKALIFVALASLRIAALIPSAVFMILGGVMFNPFEGAVLTLISVLLSESLVFIISKILVHTHLQDYLVKKSHMRYGLLLKNNTRILALGILCPLAPSDLACFLAGSTGVSYRKFILTVVLSNLPMMILYSFLGNNVMSSTNNTVIILVIIAAMSIYSIYLWNKEQRVQSLA